MAAASNLSPAPIGMSKSREPTELAVHLAHSPGLRVHLHIDVLANSLLVFLTSAAADAESSSSATASMGSLVYAMPDKYNPAHPMSTVLYNLPSSVDFATRMATTLVRRLGKPCYVGSSINLSASAGGGNMDEEMDAFKAIIAVISHETQRQE